MDNIGSIIDAKIKIKPSQELIQFINNIDANKLTKNIYELKKTLHTLKENNSILITDHSTSIKLLSKDIEILNSIKSDYKEKINKDDSLETDKNKETVLNNLENDKLKDFYLELNDLDFVLEHIMQHNSSSKDKIYLHELLAKSVIILPKNEIIKRNPILEARCEKLRAEQEARHYRSMTKNVDNRRKHEPEDTIAYQIKQINRQLIAVLQFLFSVVAGFVFGFIGLELMFGDLDFGFRLLMGIMFALIIAIAEIYFLAKKLNEEEVIIQVPVQTCKNKDNENVQEDDDKMKTKIKLNKQS